MAYKRQGALLPINGLDTSKPAEYISEQNSPYCKNINIDHSVIRKRAGIDQLGTIISGTSPVILAGHELNLNDSQFAVRIGDDKAQVWNGSTVAWDAITTGDLATTDTDEVATCTPTLSGNRILVFTSEALAPQKYTGTGNHADLGGSPPKAKYCENFGAYTILSHITDDGGSTYRNRVQWSDTGLPETWTGSNAGSTDLFDGNYDITGLKRFGNYLSVHKQDVVYMGYLVSSDTVIKFDAKYTPGAICNNTIRQLPNGFMAYIAIDGLRLFNGTTSELVANSVNEDLKEEINFDYAYRGWSLIVQEENEYWFGIPTGSDTYATDIYRFNYLTGQVYKNNYSRNIRSAFTFSNTTNQTWDSSTGTWDAAIGRWNSTTNSSAFPIPTISSDTGYTYRIDSSKADDEGVAIDAVYETKDFQPEVDGQMARWLQLETWAKGTEVSVSYSTDKGSTWYDINTLTLNSSYPADSAPLFSFMDVVSSKIRLRFRNNNSSGTFYLKQFVLRYNPRELRGS